MASTMSLGREGGGIQGGGGTGKIGGGKRGMVGGRGKGARWKFCKKRWQAREIKENLEAMLNQFRNRLRVKGSNLRTKGRKPGKKVDFCLEFKTTPPLISPRNDM